MAALLIMVAGPYSAPTASARAANLAAMHRTAADVARRGHLPVIGVDAALPILEALGRPHSDPLLMKVSLALASALRRLPADRALTGRRLRGRDLRALERPVWARLDELPPV